jgi:hypothetical protein
LIGILVLAVLSTYLYKAFWDWRVEAMCERDGGRVIYEKVVLPSDEFKLLLDRDGDIDLPWLEKAGASDHYAISFDSKDIISGVLGLIVQRYRYQIVRLRDDELLAEEIGYSRGGGDFPFSASHSSSFGCPTFSEGSLYKQIFFELK